MGDDHRYQCGCADASCGDLSKHGEEHLRRWVVYKVLDEAPKPKQTKKAPKKDKKGRKAKRRARRGKRGRKRSLNSENTILVNTNVVFFFFLLCRRVRKLHDHVYSYYLH